MSNQSEYTRLEAVAADSWYSRGINPRTIEWSGRIFARFISGGTLLELGPAEGVMSQIVFPLVKRLTLVEGSATFCDLLRERFPDANVVHSLFEDFEPVERFDNIVLGHVLEHVVDPISILRMVRQWLTPSGRVFAAVPNSRSLHRQAAVIMGLLPTAESMSPADLHHGHRRIYNPETLQNHFSQAGFNIELFGGYWIKPVSNQQIEQSWTPQMVDAFMELGERYPEIAAEIYVIATSKGKS